MNEEGKEIGNCFEWLFVLFYERKESWVAVQDVLVYLMLSVDQNLRHKVKMCAQKRHEEVAVKEIAKLYFLSVKTWSVAQL